MFDQAFDPFEAKLAQLRPSPAKMDRDRLLYETGYAAAEASVRRRPAARVWPIAACLASAACLALLLADGAALRSESSRAAEDALEWPRVSSDVAALPGVTSPPRTEPLMDWDSGGRLTVRPRYASALADAEPSDALRGVAREAPSVRTLLRSLLPETPSPTLPGDDA